MEVCTYPKRRSWQAYLGRGGVGWLSPRPAYDDFGSWRHKPSWVLNKLNFLLSAGERSNWLSRIYIRGQDFIIIVPADDQAPSDARPSADRVRMAKVDRSASKFLKHHLCGKDNVIQYGDIPWHFAAPRVIKTDTTEGVVLLLCKLRPVMCHPDMSHTTNAGAEVTCTVNLPLPLNALINLSKAQSGRRSMIKLFS